MFGCVVKSKISVVPLEMPRLLYPFVFGQIRCAVRIVLVET